MSIEREKRTAAEMVIGAICLFVPDGTEYGDGQAAGKNNVPTFEEALAAGLNLGMISTFNENFCQIIIDKFFGFIIGNPI